VSGAEDRGWGRCYCHLSSVVGSWISRLLALSLSCRRPRCPLPPQPPSPLLLLLRWLVVPKPQGSLLLNPTSMSHQKRGLGYMRFGCQGGRGLLLGG